MPKYGSWKKFPETLPIEAQEPFWQEIFKALSVPDERMVEPIDPGLWELLEIVSKEEVEGVLRRVALEAAGPDKVTMASVKKMDTERLTAQLNLWFPAGYQTAVLREGITVLIPKCKTGLPRAEDHRPITLGSCVGRIFHKLLARRMGQCLLLSRRQN